MGSDQSGTSRSKRGLLLSGALAQAGTCSARVKHSIAPVERISTSTPGGQPGRMSKCRFCAWVMSVPTRLMKSAWSGEKNARYVRPTSIRPS